jgi:hypothetical protein
MKIAIIGNTPAALEAALKFDELETNLTFFHQDDFNINESLLDDEFEQMTSSWGRELLGKEVESYQDYYQTLWEILEEKYKRVPSEVLRVHKRYLGHHEDLQDSSRLRDLYRVVYLKDPKVMISEQKEKNPDIFDKLNEKVVSSLQEGMEAFEDFDLVIDAATLQPNDMGASMPALSENKFKGHESIRYGSYGINSEPGDIKEIAIIGSGHLAAERLVSLESWLKENTNHRIFLVTTEENPFENFLQSKSFPKTVEKLNNFFHVIDKSFEEQVIEFEKKLKEWNELDDFVQVKIRRPEEPIPQLVIFAGHNVTSVDMLIDRTKVFLTCELPEFRTPQVQKENSHLDLKTIGVDKVYVTTGHHRNLDKYKGLRVESPYSKSVVQPEPGLYFIGQGSESTDSHCLKKNFDDISEVEKSILNFFSRS